MDASKEESSLEHELHVDSPQTEELDADVQKLEEVCFKPKMFLGTLWCCLIWP